MTNSYNESQQNNTNWYKYHQVFFFKGGGGQYDDIATQFSTIVKYSPMSMYIYNVSQACIFYILRLANNCIALKNSLIQNSNIYCAVTKQNHVFIYISPKSQ